MKTEQVQEQAQKGFTAVKDGVSQLVDRAKPLADDVVKKSKDLYKDAEGYLPGDSKKYIPYVAVGLLIGVIGYQLGKKQNKSLGERASEVSSEVKENLPPVAKDMIGPTLKFLKLWMLYRLSV